MNKAGWRRAALVTVGFVVAGCQVQPPSPQPSPPVTQPRPVQPIPVPVAPSEEMPGPQTPVVAPTSGGIQNYQDRQEQYLRARLAGTGLRVQRGGDVIKVIVPAAIGFAFNGDQLQTQVAAALNNIVPVLREFYRTAVNVKGFTDSTGSFDHNQSLSERRAARVGNYLAAQGVPAARIHTAGYGPRYPIADNRTDSGRQLNRRVEIELVPTS